MYGFDVVIGELGIAAKISSSVLVRSGLGPRERLGGGGSPEGGVCE